MHASANVRATVKRSAPRPQDGAPTVTCIAVDLSGGPKLHEAIKSFLGEVNTTRFELARFDPTPLCAAVAVRAARVPRHAREQCWQRWAHRAGCGG